jgi:hypothetical protein
MNIPKRKFLCADTLFGSIYRQFLQILDPRNLPTNLPISLTDVLMCGFAIFGLKFPSLLQYDQQCKILDDPIQTFYQI